MAAVAVTGAGGYVGRRLCDALRAAGRDVLPLVRAGDGVVWGERTEPEQLASALSDADVGCVVHLAARYVTVHRPADVGPMVATNVEAGARLLEACQLAGVRRVVWTGSWFERGGPGGEPANLYAATRRAADVVLRWYARSAGIAVRRLVLHDVYGPDDARPRLVAALLRARATGEAATLLRGAGRLNLVHVDDVVAAYQIAVDDLHNGGWAEWAVRAQSVGIDEVVAALERAGGRPVPHRWVDGPAAPSGGEVAAPTPPGWVPHRLEDGLRMLLETPDVE